MMASLRSADKLAHALPVEWLPIEIDVEVMDALAAVLSRPLFDALVATRQRQEMGSALFRGFVTTTVTLLGGTPATVIRKLHKGWGQLMEDCGVVEVTSLEARSGKVLLRELPDVCLASRAWIGSLGPGMRTLYELVKTRGDVEVTMRGRDVELHFTW